MVAKDEVRVQLVQNGLPKTQEEMRSLEVNKDFEDCRENGTLCLWDDTDPQVYLSTKHFSNFGLVLKFWTS